MIRQWLRNKWFPVEGKTPEEIWAYKATSEMFHPVLWESLTHDLLIKEDAPVISYIEEPVAGCFVFPLFSERYCKYLMDRGDKNGKWGITESDPYTAFEIDMNRLSPMLFNYHKDVICMKVINAVLSGLFNGYVTTHVQNAFLIKYTLDTCRKMDYHHDENSLVSVSINLNNKFKGGGISFIRHPEEVVCPKAGWATMFAGNPFATHRALPITEGNRYTLVYWLR